ncbi:MAG: MogA/MoaB family molybdenum cofactor biosynthesis protein [Coriobacteriia bacterium]|nr:MogA/MoaB family molybdenum cofactor biosynthesis protein [Coriobacteriia bacterium]
MALKFSIITCSDTRTLADDAAGAALKELISKEGHELVDHLVVKDDKEEIKSEILAQVNKGSDIVLTCGGTGLSLRDVTPDATREVSDREVPGFGEAMRAYSMQFTHRAMLSRATAGQIGTSLVINFPGSKKAAVENWEAIADQFEHAIEMAHGGKHEQAK